MATFKALGKSYATRIASAVRRDQISEAAGLIKTASDLTYSNLGTEIIEIGQSLDGLVYEETSVPLSEEDKQEITEEIANELGWHLPKTLRKLTKSGSVDALLTMTEALNSLFTSVKK